MNILVEQIRMTRKVIKDIIEIDKDFYSDFDYSDTSWYFKRYNINNKVTVLKVDGKIVGYYLFYTISEKLLKDICELKFSGDYDFDEQEVNVASDIEYIPSVLVKKEYSQFAYRLLLQLKKDIINKKRLVAIAISSEGKRMCEKFMINVGSIEKKNVNIYILNRTCKP